MGCRLSISVVYPEKFVNKIKKSFSPETKNLKHINKRVESPTFNDEYETIYIDSP